MSTSTLIDHLLCDKRKENHYGTSVLSFHMPELVINVSHSWSRRRKPGGNDCYPGLTRSKFINRQLPQFPLPSINLFSCRLRKKELLTSRQRKLPPNCFSCNLYIVMKRWTGGNYINGKALGAMGTFKCILVGVFGMPQQSL